MLPWEEWFADRGNLEEALREAGLVGTEVHHREYKTTVTVDDFLAMREITAHASLMNKVLDTAQWESFREKAMKEFHTRCGGVVEDARDAYLAVGTKP